MIRSNEQTGSRWRMAGWGALGLMTAIAYGQTFRAPFVFDDVAAVLGNPSIRAWTDFKNIFSPPPGLSVSGRPVVNFSLAVSHALSGENPWGYHVINLAAHFLTGLLLYGFLRRALRLPVFNQRFARDADTVALIVAGVWLLHPLQTATVTYVMQRTEGLMALAYVATLYFFARGVESVKPAGWLVASVAACAVGMGCKEVMISAPLIVWLYDRNFVAGSSGAAWRTRKLFHLALAATSLILGVLVVGAQGRAGSAGWGLGMSAKAYALAQGEVILRYLKLALWPTPLVFDYGTQLTVNIAAVIAVIVLVALSLIAVARKRPVALPGFFFFAVLAPTSSVVPVVTQTLAEHRVYLPLASVVLLAVTGGYVGLGRRSLWFWPVVMVACTIATWERNLDYRSARILWADTVMKRPLNARAHYNLGMALNADGDVTGAQREWLEAVRLEPRHGQAQAKLAGALARSGRTAEALGHFEAAASTAQNDGAFLNDWGSALLAEGRAAEALEKFVAAQAALPESAEVRFNRGNALVALARGAEAMECFREAVRLRPDYAEAHYNLGAAWAEAGRYREALTEFETTLRLAPTDAAAQRNVASLRAYLGK